MLHNKQPVILASTLPAAQVDLREGQPPMVACQVCKRMRPLKRSIIVWHNVPGSASERCPGAGQRIRLDLSPALSAQRYREAVADAATIRPVYAAYCTRPEIAW